MNIEELKHALGVEISQIQLDINSLYGSNSESLERRAMLTRLQVLITVRKALMEVKTAILIKRKLVIRYSYHSLRPKFNKHPVRHDCAQSFKSICYT